MMKTLKKFIILAWYVKTSNDCFFRNVTLFIIFVCLFYWGISEAVAQKRSIQKARLQLY